MQLQKDFAKLGEADPWLPSLCCDDDWLSPPAAKTQTVKNFPSEFTGATGRITLENSLVGGSIHSVLGTF